MCNMRHAAALAGVLLGVGVRGVDCASAARPAPHTSTVASCCSARCELLRSGFVRLHAECRRALGWLRASAPCIRQPVMSCLPLQWLVCRCPSRPETVPLTTGTACIVGGVPPPEREPTCQLSQKRLCQQLAASWRCQVCTPVPFRSSRCVVAFVRCCCTLLHAVAMHESRNTCTGALHRAAALGRVALCFGRVHVLGGRWE
jgi:hypothetical protein